MREEESDEREQCEDRERGTEAVEARMRLVLASGRSLLDELTVGRTPADKEDRAYSESRMRNERLIDLCLKSGATDYLSGPSARGYVDEAAFATAGVTVHFVDYSGYREYPQLYPPFEHQVSAIDLLVHVGPEAAAHLGRQLSP